jgi:hypothetical protein
MLNYADELERDSKHSAISDGRLEGDIKFVIHHAVCTLKG